MAKQKTKRETLDELIERAEACLENLQEAARQADMLSTFISERWPGIEGVESEITGIKSRIDEWQSTINGDANTASAKLEEIKAAKETVDSQSGEINSAKQIVDQRSTEINTTKATADKHLADISSAKQTIDQHAADISSAKQTTDKQLAETAVANQETTKQLTAIKSTKASAEKQSADIAQMQKDARTSANDIQEKHKKIASFNAKLFGGGEKNDEENPCMQQKFQNLYDETEKNYGELATRIENLLPGATATGLASSFKDAKEENVVNKWLNRGFYCPILFLAAVYIGLYGYVLFTDASVTWELLVFKTTLSFPFAWMAWYCQKAIAETKKTREEYHHKQRVMELYAGFADHIKGLSADDRMSALAQVVLDTVKRNPAEQVKTESDDQLINRFTKIISAVKDLK